MGIGATPSIEVLLATWNGRPYLEALIHSIRNQSHPAQRLLVRDDGSTDGTRELLDQLSQQSPGWLVRLPDGPRLGSSGNFEALMQASCAPYLALADQDDVWDADKLERSLTALRSLELQEGPSCPLLVHSDLRLIDANGRSLAPSFLSHQSLNPMRCTSDALVLQNVVTGCSCLFNRPLLEQALPLPPAARQHDHWLALVASRCGRIGFIASPLISYRQHAANSIGASGAGFALVLHQLKRMRRAGPLQPLRQALAQALALQHRCPGPPLTLVEFSKATAGKRLLLLLDPRLRVQGWLRQLGLLMLLPWLPADPAHGRQVAARR